MKRLIFYVIPILLCSCSTSRHVQMQVAEHIQRGTVYLRNVQYDSIYINHTSDIDRTCDTIKITETLTEYRYKLLRDTIERIKLEVRHDSIPYEVRITEVKEVKYIPPWCKWLSAVIGGIFLWLIIKSRLTKR